MRLHVRWMIRRDLPAVLAAENGGLKCRNPWTEEDFCSCLRQRNCIGMVAEEGETVVGFMVYDLHKKKLEIVRIGVAPMPEEQQAQVLVELFDKLKSKLSDHRRNRIVFTVDERDVHLQVALRANGFQAVRIEECYFCDEDDSLHDGYRFVWRLPVGQEEATTQTNEVVV